MSSPKELQHFNRNLPDVEKKRKRSKNLPVSPSKFYQFQVKAPKKLNYSSKFHKNT